MRSAVLVEPQTYAPGYSRWALFPVRVDVANHAIDFLKAVDRGLDALDWEGLKAAQAKHDAIGALRIAQKALFGAF